MEQARAAWQGWRGVTAGASTRRTGAAAATPTASLREECAWDDEAQANDDGGSNSHTLRK